MTAYERYCSMMRERDLEPTLSETELHKAWGIEPVDESVEFIARQNSTARNVVPTLENNIRTTSKTIDRGEFARVDDYFDAIEAQRILDKIRAA